MSIANPFYRRDTAPVHDILIAGEQPRDTKTVTLLSGTNYKRGMVLGMVTASRKWTLSLSAASDGSQVPDAICWDDVDATAGDVKGPILQTGDVNPAALILGTGHTLTTIEDPLRLRGIFLKTTVPA